MNMVERIVAVLNANPDLVHLSGFDYEWRLYT